MHIRPNAEVTEEKSSSVRKCTCLTCLVYQDASRAKCIRIPTIKAQRKIHLFTFTQAPIEYCKNTQESHANRKRKLFLQNVDKSIFVYDKTNQLSKMSKPIFDLRFFTTSGVKS